MNDGLKQRIIGAVVLVALGILFIPVLFDKERIEPVDRATQIPPEPELQPLPLPEAATAPRTPAPQVEQPIDGEFAIEDVEPAVEPAPSTPAPKPTPVELEGPQTADAWVLQIASYKFENHASALRDELIGRGYKSFIKTVDTSSGPRTRLYVGPSIDKASLEQAKRELDNEYRVEAMLLKFSPK